MAGNTQITGSLKLSNLAGTGYAIVYTDSAGNLLKTIPNPGGGNGIGSTPCLPNTIPWFEGGNNVDLTVNGSNYAGTCNNVDFILKSNKIMITTEDNGQGFDLQRDAGHGRDARRVHGGRRIWTCDRAHLSARVLRIR